MNKNNPVQQRMNIFLVEWTAIINRPNIKVVRIHTKENDLDMVDAYYEFMTAVDTNQEDFVVIFESKFNTLEIYGSDLVKELQEQVDMWNSAQKPPEYDDSDVDWQADYTIGKHHNVAELFARNLNTFANYISPHKDIKVSLVLRMHFIDKKNAYIWLNDLMKCHLEPHIIIAVNDTHEYPLHQKIADQYPKEVFTVAPDFDTDKVLEELAASGDPAAPETPFRTNMIKLMKAVKDRAADRVQHHAKKCLTIAFKQVKKDPLWISQIVGIYTILYSDQIGYKDFEKAIFFAQKANESALLTENLIDPGLSYRLIGQTHLGLGALYFNTKKFGDALSNYEKAAYAYANCQDFLMQCESLRQCGIAGKKSQGKSIALDYFLKAYQLKPNLKGDMVKNSSFPFVVKELLKYRQLKDHISPAQMDRDMTPVFGEDWQTVIKKYGKAPNVHQFETE